MNRWARRHFKVLVDDLEEGEELLAAGRVMINAAVPPPALSDHRHAGSRSQTEAPADTGFGNLMGAYQERLQRRAARGRGGARNKTRAAQQIGFPAPGPVMVVGFTSQRLVIWRPTAVRARPGGIIADFPLDRVADVRLLHRFGMSRLAVTLPSGASLVLQNLWCRSLPALAAAFEQATSARSKFPAS